MNTRIALRPAVLLDRDGTIIFEKNYLSDPDMVELERDAVEGLRSLSEQGFVLVVVSNQSGIGRGYFGIEAAEAVNRRVDQLLRAEGVAIAGWYICPHSADEACACRKPMPGMALEAAADLGIDLTRSFVIGDKRSDAELAHAVGAIGILVTTGHGDGDVAWARSCSVPVCQTLADAARIVGATALPSLAELDAAGHHWITHQALPLWSTAGFDATTDSFEERLTFDHQVEPDAPRRLMVQARQISVFARATIEGDFPAGADLAKRAGHAMIARYLEADGKPGWVFSVDRSGRVVDGTRDLYAHAFVIFALAWLTRVANSPVVEDAIAKTLAFLDLAFADPVAGGYWDSLPRKDALRRQNPHMHLFEALIELAEVAPSPALIARCRALDGLALAHFLDPETWALREVFHDDWRVAPRGGQGSVEPGHQMEWAWLWARYAAISGDDRRSVVSGLINRALETGVDRIAGRIVDECGEDGVVRKHTSRSWPHAEALKAMMIEVPHARRDLLGVYKRIYHRLLHKYCNSSLGGGWIDQLDDQDMRASTSMPASSLYHIYFGLKSIRTLLEQES